MSFVEQLRTVPVQRIFSPFYGHEHPYAMTSDFNDLPQILPIYEYSNLKTLMAALESQILSELETRYKRVRPRD